MSFDCEIDTEQDHASIIDRGVGGACPHGSRGCQEGPDCNMQWVKAQPVRPITCAPSVRTQGTHSIHIPVDTSTVSSQQRGTREEITKTAPNPFAQIISLVFFVHTPGIDRPGLTVVIFLTWVD